MKKVLIAFLFLAALQNQVFAGDDLKPFIPKGYMLADTVTADLNVDGQPDVLLVLAIDDDLDSFQLSQIFPRGYNYAARPFVILARQGNGQLKKVKSNNHIIPDWLDEHGQLDPLDDLKATSGSFTVTQVSLIGDKTCTSEIRFKYDATLHDWLLGSILQRCMTTNDAKAADKFYNGDVILNHTVKDFGKVLFSNYDCRKYY